MTKETFENIKLLEEAATALLQLVTAIVDVREELSSILPNGKLMKIPTLLVSLEKQLMFQFPIYMLNGEINKQLQSNMKG